MKKKLLLLSIPLLAIPFQITHAKEFNVNTFVDEIDVNPGDGECKTRTGECSLRAAIMEANDLKGLDKIRLPSGTFSLTRQRINNEGKEGLDPSGGDLDILDNIEIIGAGKERTLIDNSILGDRAINFVADHKELKTFKLSGVSFSSPVTGVEGSAINLSYVHADFNNIKMTDGASVFYVLQVNNGSLKINNSLFTNNRHGIVTTNSQVKISNSIFDSNGSDDEHGHGGALRINSGDAEIDNCEFTNNGLKDSGGAIYAVSSNPLRSHDHVLLIRNSVFRNNIVNEDSGGAVSTWQFETHIENSEFIGNESSYRGGAVSFLGSGSEPLTISSTTFQRNRTTFTDTNFGGGALHFGLYGLLTARAETYLKKVRFIDNQSAAEGGAILGYLGPLKMEEVVIRNNITKGHGGGIYLFGSITDWSKVRISASEISNNTAGQKGGGIYREAIDDVLIENTTLSGNSASEGGGGIYNRNKWVSYPMLLKNVTIMDNHSSAGSAINNESGSVTIVNSVIDQSKGGQACVGELLSRGGNISDDSSCGFTHTTDHASVSSGLAALNRTSGFTAVHASSPQALAYQNAAPALCPELDQLLHYRKSANTCDSGAHQSGAALSKSGTINFERTTYIVQRGNATRVELKRTGGTEGSVSVVVWDPEFGDAESGFDSPAEPDKTGFGDYYMGGQYIELNWSDGEGGSKFVDVTTNKSPDYNGTKSFPLTLIRNFGGVNIGNKNSTRVTIQDGNSGDGVTDSSNDVSPVNSGTSNSDDDSSDSSGANSTAGTSSQNDTSGGGGNMGVLELILLFLTGFVGLRRRL